MHSPNLLKYYHKNYILSSKYSCFYTNFIKNDVVSVNLTNGFRSIIFIVGVDWLVNQAEITVYICRATGGCGQYQ